MSAPIRGTQYGTLRNTPRGGRADTCGNVRHREKGSPRVKIAFYGRYSSDNQRDTSIDDQRRIVQRWAERHGHELVLDCFDSAISGASVHRLTGLQEAIRAACVRPAQFEAIVVDQLSRLSRDVGDTDAIVKRLRFFGVRIIAVSDGLDTGDENTKISVRPRAGSARPSAPPASARRCPRSRRTPAGHPSASG